MIKLIAVLALCVIAWGISILVMMYGWGLEPKSWGWIIGAGIAGQVIIHTMQAIAKEVK